MNNKFYLLLFFINGFAICAQAQSITQRTITSGGRYLTNQGLSLNFTVGELVIENLKDSAVGITTGLFGKQNLVFREQPVVTGTVSLSESSFCASGSATLRSTGYTPGRYYQWQYSIDSFITDVHDLPEQTTPDSSFTGTITTTTYYRLKVCCASATSPVYSNIVRLTVNHVPPTPTISQSASKLVSSSPGGNQWYLNGNAIAGATDTVYVPAVSGNYSVQATVNGCSSQRSADFAFVITAINDPVPEGQIQVYPNPFNSKIIITNRSTETMSVQLYDISGRLLLSRKVLVGTHEIETTALARGLYIIQIKGKRAGKFITKLIKKH
jgi:hypothetical protein